MPRVFLARPATLAHTRRRALDGDEALKPALTTLTKLAEEALADGPFSVTHKQMVPPSGDKRDYLSVGPYWWPNPDTQDGLPYVCRDGQVNPERGLTGDSTRLARFLRSVIRLGHAYYFTGQERYAEHAALLLRAWFIDPQTRMNPNMRYAQSVPGIAEGRQFGLVDLAAWPDMIDAIGMLEDSRAWTEGDQRALQDWFAEFLGWCQTHPFGLDESRYFNNHASQMHVQLASYALFIGQPDRARDALVPRFYEMIESHINADGMQPHEAERTLSWHYSTINLCNLFNLAALGERVGLNLWDYSGPDGQNLRAALDYVLAYVESPRDWPHKQIKPIDASRTFELLSRAAVAFDEPRYAQLLRRMADDWPSRTESLIYPLE